MSGKFGLESGKCQGILFCQVCMNPDMNMFARYDENPAMTLQDMKETKRYGHTHARAK